MKLSPKTMEKMLAAGIIVGTAAGWKVVFLDGALKSTRQTITPASFTEDETREMTYVDRYYEKKREIYYWGVAKGIFPPPPPCGMCGAG